MSANARAEALRDEPPVTRKELECLRTVVDDLLLWKEVILDYLSEKDGERDKFMSKLTARYQQSRAVVETVKTLHGVRA